MLEHYRRASIAYQGRTSTYSVDPSTSHVDNADENSTKRILFTSNRQRYRIVHETSDLTPLDLKDDEFATALSLPVPEGDSNIKPGQRSDFTLETISSQGTESDTGPNYLRSAELDNVIIDQSIDTEWGAHKEYFEKAPSSFYLPKLPVCDMYPPEFFVILRETETIYLLEIPSTSYERDTPECTAIEKENEFYQYLTVGKGRNRKTVTAETQTNERIVQSRHTMAPLPSTSNQFTYASLWDMHDSYAKGEEVKTDQTIDDMVMYQSAADHLLRKKRKSKVAAGEIITKSHTELDVIMSNSRFRDALLLTERALANNVYKQQQKLYRDLIVEDPLRLDLQYKYSFFLLWTFSSEETEGTPVLNICFNPMNGDIIATAYGQFTYADVKPGIICIWCTKNPRKPERTYRFNVSVTAIAFSERTSNWLACGFYNGDVLILDITSHSKKIIAQSSRKTSPCVEPVWVVNWGLLEGSVYEYVMTTCQDGRINRYVTTKSHEFLCTPMMRVTQVEGKTKGVSIVRPSTYPDVPISRHPGAVSYSRHPTQDHIYLVGTDEGCIHKCSTNYVNQHMEVFRAHVGPAYGVQFSPFCNRVFLTCGADWAVRIWVEDIEEPLLTFNCPQVVYGASWCPVNSTIVVAISGTSIFTWDIRRKCYMPSSEHKLPAKLSILTVIQFSKSGKNLLVGDCVGNMHTFHMEDMPIPPFYQSQVLEDSLRKSVSTKPHLSRQLDKILSMS